MENAGNGNCLRDSEQQKAGLSPSLLVEGEEFAIAVGALKRRLDQPRGMQAQLGSRLINLRNDACVLRRVANNTAAADLAATDFELWFD
jgi:hypothetical protein